MSGDQDLKRMRYRSDDEDAGEFLRRVFRLLGEATAALIEAREEREKSSRNG